MAIPAIPRGDLFELRWSAQCAIDALGVWVGALKTDSADGW